jgi:GT2 family glycosyltransferase
VACALVARTATLRRLGPFDERIFLYGEDLDLGLRAAASGVETWFWPRARVLHHRAHSSARAFGGEPFELLARGRHEVVARRMGAGRGRLDDAAQTVTFASRAALKRALGRDAVRERRQLDALARVARGQG